MRIAMIGQKGIPARFGGVERHVHDISVRLVQAGHAVTVYSRAWYSLTEAKEVNGVKIQHIPTIESKHFDTITHTFLSTVHALFSGFDVIHYHGVGPALLAWIPRLFARNTKVVVTFHSIDRHHQKWGLFAKWFLRLGELSACKAAHTTITVSRSLEHYCLNEFNTETTYIPNGTILPAVKKSDATELQKFNLTSGNYLLMVSRLIPHKGAHLLLEAFQNLKHDYAQNPDIAALKLVIVGDGSHTDAYVARLKESVKNNADIIFTGFQTGKTLEALYRGAQALIHPSLNEGLPLTVLEAMSYRLPVLLSDIPEHLELITDTRALFHKNNVSALEKTILTFLKYTPVEKMELGNNNRLIIETKYSWDTLVPQITAVYTAAPTTTRAEKPLITELA